MPRICGWLLGALLVLSRSECCESQQEQPQHYHSLLPSVHAGVERDFHDIVSKQEPGERMLQNSLELAFCYDALYLADANNDNMVDRDEFVTFAQIMGPPGFLPNSESYGDLPLILQSNFIILACLCLQLPTFDGGSQVNPQCCAVDPHIDVTGSQPGEIPTPQQSQYLYQVCFLTETSIERLLLSETPTIEPSKPPIVVTDRPTRNPTLEPTGEPTQEPTRKPSEKPTGVPTAKPSRKPTGKPTSIPSEEPTNTVTDEPTDPPTGVPTAKPSRKPTGEPTRKVTDRPTGSSTDTSTVKITESPTDKPTIVATDAPTDIPTIAATDEPTVSPTTLEPTVSPTMPATTVSSVKPTPLKPEPTMRPTVKDDNVTSSPTSSSDVPTGTPTRTITTEPTAGSTMGPAVEVAVVEYGIAITDGKTQDVPLSAYESDLIESMNIVAVDVAIAIDLGKRRLHKDYRRSLRQSSRKLAALISVKLPTAIDDVVLADCEWFVPPNDECKTVTASVVLSIAMDTPAGRQDTTQGLSNPAVVKELFQESFNTAIESGLLQAALIEVNPNSVVSITTGAAPPTSSPTSSPTAPATQPGVPISPGGIAGIVLAGIGGLIIGLIVICALRRQGLEAGGGNAASVYGIPDDDVEEAGSKEGVAQPAPVVSIDESDKVRKFDETTQSPVIVDSGPPVVDTGSPERILAVAAGAAVGTAAAYAATSTSGSDGHDVSTSPALYQVPGAKGIIPDDASSAGESGWSSNQDGSSANTSIDASLDSIPQSNFAGIAPVVLGDVDETGVASESIDETLPSPASPEKLQSSEQEQTTSVPQAVSPMASISPSTSMSPHSVGQSQDNSYTGTTGTDGSIQSTYSELDEAIQKGDWAAVGVTAALLASQAYGDDSTFGSSKQSNTKLRRQNPPLNPERAAELDRLVESGDWEGVVAAAAKFDAQEALRGDAQSSQQSTGSVFSSGGSHNSSAMSGSGGGSSTGTAPSNVSESQTIDTTTSPSTYTATGQTLTSDTASTRSKARKLNEIRDEVEALVNAVVPEEADNVDEMMTQFKGREEELVETLRSMQERQVAQKARKESQKQAKRQAKEYVQDKKKQETFEALDTTGNAADDMWMKEIENTEATDGDAPSNQAIKTDKEDETNAMKSQLKEAIDKEDWQNVAEAAAGLSGHPSGRNTPDSNSQSSDRSKDINALVDEGDWDGVVAAASRYAEASTNTSSTNNDFTVEETQDEVADDSTIEERRKRREERLKEEEEALAQAQIWDAIADQTKVDSNEKDEGAAGLAADWAIDQSLAALKKAEEADDNESLDSAQDEKGDNESL